MSGGLEKISAIVLAAGRSARMGENKLLMPFRGRPMLAHILDLIDALSFGERILVASQEIANAVKIPESFAVTVNPSPEDGQASSMKLGLTAANLDYYMFFQADMPFLDKSTVLAIAAQIEDGKIIVPYVQDAPVSPVIFHKKFRRKLLEVTGDKGGRSLIAEHKSDCKAVIFENARAFEDIDTPEEYKKHLGF